ncbi:MAG: hypothetical protein ACREFP_14740 [Acetobacteraceae bacterium]
MLLHRLGLAIAGGLAAAVGVAFLLAAADYRLAAVISGWLAAAIVGAGLLIVGGILLGFGLHRPRVRALAPEDVALAALGLVARSVRAAPEKALIAAMIAGVVSEWLANEHEVRKG